MTTWIYLTVIDEYLEEYKTMHIK